MEISSIIDTTRHDTTRHDTTRHDRSDFPQKVVIIGTLRGVMHAANCIEECRNYICIAAVAENSFGKNFWPYFLGLGFKQKIVHILQSSIEYYRSSKEFNRKSFTRIPKRYFATRYPTIKSLELVPDSVLNDSDLFLIMCEDDTTGEYESKSSDYVTTLLQRGISKEKIFIVPPVMYRSHIPIIKDEKLSTLCRNILHVKPVLRHLEHHITDFCNLKCKGCLHLSQYIRKLEFSGVDNFRNSMVRLREKFSNITVICLMGGEPLLCKDLHEYIKIAREAFPCAHISILSNGLLYRNITSVMIQAIHDAGVEFRISQYPPTSKIAEDIVAFCEANNIKLTISTPVKTFVKRLEYTGDVDCYEKWCQCGNRYCHLLHNTTLYPCTYSWTYSDPQFKSIVAERFIDEKEAVEYSYNLAQDISDDGWDILVKLEHSMKICRKCGGNKVDFTWESELGIN